MKLDMARNDAYTVMAAMSDGIRDREALADAYFHRHKTKQAPEYYEAKRAIKKYRRIKSLIFMQLVKDMPK